MTTRTARWLLITPSLCLFLLFFSAPSLAAFITDKIVVEVRAQNLGQGAVVKKLSSGSSVEVLLPDGKYSRIRTTDNLTGWVESRYLTNEKPTQLEFLELLRKSKATETKLRAAEKKLASAPEATSSSVSAEDLAKLEKQVEDAKWMRAEMNKAREHAKQLEAKIKSKEKKTSVSQADLDALRTKNKDLDKRLAAVLLINEQQETQITAAQQASVQTLEAQVSEAQALETQESEVNVLDGITHQGDAWMVKIEWLLGGILGGFIIGIMLGISWLDKRMRKRHGGFRI